MNPAPARPLASTEIEVLPLLGLGAGTLAVGAWLTVVSTRGRARRGATVLTVRHARPGGTPPSGAFSSGRARPMVCA